MCWFTFTSRRVFVAGSTVRSSALCTNMSWGARRTDVEVVAHAAIDNVNAARSDADGKRPPPLVEVSAHHALPPHGHLPRRCLCRCGGQYPLLAFCVCEPQRARLRSETPSVPVALPEPIADAEQYGVRVGHPRRRWSSGRCSAPRASRSRAVNRLSPRGGTSSAGTRTPPPLGGSTPTAKPSSEMSPAPDRNCTVAF